MSFEKFKFNKQLINGLHKSGINDLYEIQERTIKRIFGGQDLIITGPEGVGKTTTLVMAVVHKLKYPQDEAPRALIMVPDKLSITLLLEKFESIGAYSKLRCMGLYAGTGIDAEKDDLADGVDVVIGTPDRIQAIYYKSGLNINKLQMFVLDDADLLVKQGFQTQILQMVETFSKCQHIAFSEVYHSRLENMLEQFMKKTNLVEIEHLPESHLKTILQILYKIPNYKTKLNLLNLLMQDYELFDKVLVLCNSTQTTEKLYKSLDRRLTGQILVYDGHDSTIQSTDSIQHFMENESFRVLITTFGKLENFDFAYIPFVLCFDLPDTETFIALSSEYPELETQRASILFATDLELNQVVKYEQAAGQKIQEEELPLGLIIEGNSGSKKSEDSETEQEDETFKSTAFHEKKAKNAKDYNWGYKDKLKMFGTKYRGKKKF
jgi:ATP-dependent RNA helicase RhlE